VIWWLLPSAIEPPGRLGMMAMPGCKPLRRDLDADLQALSAERVNLLVTLNPELELLEFSAPDFFARVRSHAIESLHFPIVDGDAPHDLAVTDRLVRGLDQRIRKGECVILHCLAGLGRTGTLAACLLVARGATFHESLRVIRAARHPRAVETAMQEAFVASYAQYVREQGTSHP
jgi:protein-tyrosine phosphatase